MTGGILASADLRNAPNYFAGGTTLFAPAPSKLAG